MFRAIVAQNAMLPISPERYTNANPPLDAIRASSLGCAITSKNPVPSGVMEYAQKSSPSITTIRIGDPMFCTHLIWSIPLYATHAMKMMKIT